MKKAALESVIAQLLPLAAVGLALYWIYKRLPTVADIGRAGSEAWGLLTNPTVSSQFLSSVALPDGSVIPVTDILNAGSAVDSNGFFTWAGTQYQITGRDPDLGYYLTKRIIT